MSDPTPHLERFETYEQACQEFRPLIPQTFNIATAICRRHSDAVTRVALSEAREAGDNTYTFGGLDFLSDKFAAALSESGICEGDSVAVLLPQSSASLVAQLGVLKTGAVVVPLSTSSYLAWLDQVIVNSGVKALIIAESVLDSLVTSVPRSVELRQAFVVRDLRPPAGASNLKDFWSEVDRASSDFKAVEVAAIEPAFIFYEQSRGGLIGVVHSHASLIGQLASFEMCNNLEINSSSVYWAADDWCSLNTPLGVLYPALWYGCSVIAADLRDDSGALSVMDRSEVTHSFLCKARLESLAQTQPHDRGALKLRTIITDAPPSAQVRDWSEQPGSPKITEIYSRSEAGWIAESCERWFSKAAGSVGRVVPGRIVEIIDETGRILPSHAKGIVAVHKSDPALFIRYHAEPDRSASAFVGDWFATDEHGYKNDDGDLFLCSS